MEYDSTVRVRPMMAINQAESLYAQARLRLTTHLLDVKTSRCTECGEEAPCHSANEAAEILTNLGTPLTEARARIWPARIVRLSTTALAMLAAASAPRLVLRRRRPSGGRR